MITYRNLSKHPQVAPGLIGITVYHNDQEVQGQQIGGQEAEGVVQKNWFEAEVKAGDILQFVMQKNGNAQNDHTFFLVQIYQQ